ncbi:MAG: chorismate mutase [Halanaerobiaceae bacterium]
MRGIRGAITVEENTEEKIIDAVQVLLEKIIVENDVNKEEIVSIIFTATDDLDQEYPAVGARQLGFKYIPLMCYQEMKVQGSLSSCIRIMMYVERSCEHQEINHIYLRKAKSLRPDLTGEMKT